MKSYELRNLDCANCAFKLESALKKSPEVTDVSINFATATMKINTRDFKKSRALIKGIEPTVEVIDSEAEADARPQFAKRIVYLSVMLVLYFIGVFFQDFLHSTFFEIPEYLYFVTLYLITGWPVLRAAGRNILRGDFFDENFLMSLATIGAFVIHAIPEAVGVMIFYEIGRFFEDLALSRSRNSIKSLMDLRPDFAWKLDGGEALKTVPAAIKVGDMILVKPGERVPLDGVVQKGELRVDSSAITGESVPRRLKAGDEILAGMIVLDAAIEIKVTRIFSQSSVSRILELVESAVQKKAKTEKFITRFAKIYTPVVVFMALGLALIPPFVLQIGDFTQWLYRAFVILVISCPCALVISIPLGYFSGIGRASKKGILIKGSNYIDVLSKVDQVVFDKTGTLTKGEFKVTSIVNRNGFSEDQLLEYAALAEFHSNHPIALSIKRAYESAGNRIDPKRISSHQEKQGYGVIAQLDGRELVLGNDKYFHVLGIDHEDCGLDSTAAYLAVDKKYAGYITIGDEIKEDSAKALVELKKLGVKKTVMLTGDNEETARLVADKLKLDGFYAQLLPEDKTRKLEALMKNNRGKTMFVGDGINDAPVIAQADIGAAMGKLGSDAAIETADLVLMTDSPAKIPEALKLSRATRSIVFQNIFIALTIKIIFVAFGAFGLAGMWEAVFADVGVTLLAILNSLRLLKA